MSISSPSIGHFLRVANQLYLPTSGKSFIEVDARGTLTEIPFGENFIGFERTEVAEYFNPHKKYIQPYSFLAPLCLHLPRHWDTFKYMMEQSL